jgi:hypothetical protein
MAKSKTGEAFRIDVPNEAGDQAVSPIKRSAFWQAPEADGDAMCCDRSACKGQRPLWRAN